VAVLVTLAGKVSDIGSTSARNASAVICRATPGYKTTSPSPTEHATPRSISVQRERRLPSFTGAQS
jgi:hypothetical protein